MSFDKLFLCRPTSQCFDVNHTITIKLCVTTLIKAKLDCKFVCKILVYNFVSAGRRKPPTKEFLYFLNVLCFPREAVSGVGLFLLK